MFKNYVKSAFRNLVKNKVHGVINIAGLSIGMAVAILIGLWIWDELSFDKKFQHNDRIARVIQNVTNNGSVQTWMDVPYPLGEELRKNYGNDFRQVITAGGWGEHLLSYNDKRLSETGAFFEDGVIDLFSLPMLQGNRQSLNDPSSVILSASAARAYFGDADPMNRMIKIDNRFIVKVTGVYKDFPRNSSMNNMHFIGTWKLYYDENGLKTMEDPWRPNSFALFVRLNDNADIRKVSLRIRDAKLKKVNAQLARKKPELFLHPMSKWHLYGEFKNGVNTGGAIQYVWLFGIIGVFVLLLACINFMNLSTARSERRAKEVGIRKSIGSLRRQLVEQFMSESLVVVVAAFACALLLVQLALPFFNIVADKQMTILWGNPFFWLLCLGFVLVTALVVGSYPALYLSSFKPVKVLKGTFKAGRLAALPRTVLVVVQFTVSVVLTIGTAVVYRQIQFVKNRPVGYERERLITVPMITDHVHRNFTAVKNELLQTGAVTAVAESGSPTTDIWNSSSGFNWKGKDPDLSVNFGAIDVSQDFGKTVGWTIKEGRDFSREFISDSTAVILNEAAARFMNLQHPVGETITWWGKPYTVIGVVDNLVMESPFDEPRPVVFSALEGATGTLIIKMAPALSMPAALERIAQVWKQFNPDEPFSYRFVSEEYARKFNNEEQVGKLSGFFATLAVFISCMGLFGMAAFMAEQRVKEIGVRKVLGASVWNLWGLLSKDFVQLVLFAILMAIPIAYYTMHKWLLSYEVHTRASWWIFAAAAAGALLITMLTVSFQGIKAALANPVKSLRSE